ncbi:PAS domain S-box [Hoeflea sp. IMCC20628]|uniref:response regulator n=1 Tax=Hoeflea sp. IMCC20628 TaxID=1620421 RepID=UPI00063A93E9|nr:response regulator [Hoeflea sp. IMCC20628]AKI01702.1 PAS domain S-box [Hoeflea sp. IMCC20628]
MALSESGHQQRSCEAKTIEGLALALDIGILIYDRNDTLTAASSQVRRFFDVPPEVLAPGARLRDLFSATYDVGAGVLGSSNGKPRNISREDWIAERIAVHWRERYESIEKLVDGRWVRLCKRRMSDGVLISTIADVTNHKHQEAELSRIRHQAELAQHILDNLANPVMVKDSQLRYVVVNDAFCRIPGLHPKQVLGRTAGELVEPELAARFERIEGEVLETGVPYEVVEDIYRADGSVMHAITRVRRSGTPGNYYVTISFDDVSAFVESGMFQPKSISRYDKDMPATARSPHKQVSSASQSGPTERVLVLDENRHRSAIRVAELKSAGSDAVAIANAEEIVAFLDAVRSANLDISDVEISTGMAIKLSGMAFSARHSLLKHAVERRIAEGTTRPTVSAEQPKLAVEVADPVATLEPAQQAAEGLTGSDKHKGVSPPRGRTRVLVAEDNDVNQIVFEQILEAIGVDFRIVTNGHEAVAAWEAAVPDLILMDISMPGMNGLQATQAIRDAESVGNKPGAHVPIIAVTAHAMNGDKERCFAAGMDDYLSKPVSPEKLESVIEKWLGNSETVLAVG